MRYLFFIFILFTQSYSLLSQWKKCNCSYRDVVNEFVRFGENIYAGSEDGLLKSTDNGVTWNTFIKNESLRSIKSIVKIADTLYLCDGDALYTYVDKDPDVKFNKYFLFSNVSGISSKKDTLVAYYGGRIYFCFPKTGEMITKGNVPSQFSPKALFLSGSTFFATTNGKGVVRSTDYGVTWEESNDGLEHKYISSIAFGGEQIFVSTFGKGYVSNDNGKHWNRIKSLEKETVQTISCNTLGTFCSTSSGLLYSDDKTETWSKIPFPKNENQLVVSVWENDGTLLIRTNREGTYRSSDMGKSWLKTGKYCKVFYDLNTISNVLYGYESAVYYSDNNSEFWNKPGYYGKIEGTKDVLFRLTTGSDAAVYRSYDNGEKWTLLIDAKSIKYPDKMLYNKGVLYVTHDRGIMISKNDGDIWSDSTPVDTSITTISAYEDKVFIQFKNGVVYYTDNDAQSWSKLETPFGKKFFQFITLNGNIFASTEDDLQRTTDGGITWQSVGFTKRRVRGIITVGNSIVYGMNGRVIVTDVAGEMQYNWGNLKEEIYDIVRVGDTLFASTSLGMWKSSVKSVPTSVDGDYGTISGEKSVQLFPNPASSAITVQMQTDMPYTYIIINQLGETVQAGTVEENGFSHQVSVSTLSSGAYTFITRTNGIIHKQMFSVIK